MSLCEICEKERANVKRFTTGQKICKNCFSYCFEEEVYDTCKKYNLIQPGDVVGVGVSGGKDSVCLLHVLNIINERHNMGFKIQMICIDEGITGYRDNAISAVRHNAERYKLPHAIIPFTELFGWTLDDIFKATQTKETCTYCGIFRRRALDIGAKRVGANKVAVGHNANDVAETVLLNVMRGDVARFGRSVDIITDGIDAKLEAGTVAPRIKPFAFQTQRDIVLYVHLHKLEYYAVECPYAVQAFRRFSREYLVEKEKKDPGVMRRIIEGSIEYQSNFEKEESNIGFCEKCGAASNHKVCMACKLLERLAAAHAKREIVPDNEEDKNE
jgi:cytoplasmic tRNA 2-thiolation protein 1